MNKKVMLMILDGWGIATNKKVSAVDQAKTPFMDSVYPKYANSRLEASGEAVGLPAGQMGNSEVGHLNIGAGRPVLQDLPRIDAAIANGAFFERPALLEACGRAREGHGRLSVVGLVGPGGVHAHDRHLVALAELARRERVPAFRLHALLDGRDTPPRSADAFVPALEARLRAAHPDARIATIGGRYYAMDRDKRWDRTKAGYDAIVHGVGEHAPSARAAIERSYAADVSDEFVRPTVIDPPAGGAAAHDGPLTDGEPIIHANFRADRARQLTHALADPAFATFDRAAPDGRAAPRDLL